MHTRIKLKEEKHVYEKNIHDKISREAFMTLKLQDRRRILREQSGKLAAYYSNDTEWKDFQALDLLEDE